MGVLIAHPRSGGRRRQQGMALIIVLMLFAILAAVTTEVMFRQDRFRVRTENLLEWDKRYQYAMAAEVVAVQGLIDDLDEERSNLNNDDTHINRGFELLLRRRRKKPEPPKTFQIKFGKMVALFRREIVFHLNLYLDIRKK